MSETCDRCGRANGAPEYDACCDSVDGLRHSVERERARAERAEALADLRGTEREAANVLADALRAKLAASESGAAAIRAALRTVLAWEGRIVAAGAIAPHEWDRARAVLAEEPAT